MSKLIYYPLVLTFLTGVYLLVQAFTAPEEHIFYREIAAEDKSGKVLIADTLAPKTKTDLFVLPSPEREVFWRIATPASDTIYLIEYTQPYTFTEEGTYHIEAYHKLRKVGTSTVHIPEGQHVKFSLAETSLTEGESVTAKDVSTAKAESRRWRVTASGKDVALNDPADATEFTWTATKKGEYTLHLEYLDANGQVALYDSKDIEVLAKPAPVRTATPAPTPTPKREPSAAEIQAAKDKQAERDRLRQEQLAANESKKREAEEKERGEKEKGDLASLPSWYDHKGGAPFTVGPVTPEDRREVAFKSGMTVFTIKAKADFALISLRYWGNSKSDGDVTVQIECLSCKDQKKLRAIKFTSGQTTNVAGEANVATNKGFVKGHTYKVQVTTEKEKELGFAKLTKMQWDDLNMELKFETSETPVYGLTFQKR